MVAYIGALVRGPFFKNFELKRLNISAAIQTGPSIPEMRQADLFVMGPSIYKNFLHFHVKYPQVFLLFEKFALQLIQAGHVKLGAKMIMERIRWEIQTGSKDADGFKINNNYTAYYSRLFIKNHPEYKDFFEFRIIRRM